jgi:hypothetical protein
MARNRRIAVVALALGSLLGSGCAVAVSDPVYGPGGHPQRNPAVAFDGTNFLAVWADLRNPTPQDPFSYDIYAARITPNGAVLDLTGIPIAQNYPEAPAPDVAFDGTNFLVVWNGGSIYGARVSPDGVVLDPEPFIVGGGGPTSGPAISAGGGSSLVTWEACVTNCAGPPPRVFQTQGARVSPSGVVLDSIEIGPPNFGIAPHRPDVAFDGTNHLVVWQQAILSPSLQYNVLARRISPAGTAVGEAFPITSQAGSEESPAVGFDGTNFLAVWNTDPVSITGRVRGARVTPGAVVLDASGFDISTARGSAPTVAFDGTNHFVAWATPTGPVNDDDPLLGRRVSPDGSLVDPVVRSLGQGLHPSLGAGEGVTLLSFESIELIGFLRPAEVRATRLSGPAPVDDPPFVVTNPANDQLSPSIAFDGTRHLVVWADQRPGFEYDIYAGRIGPDGKRLDGSGIAISTAPGNQLEPTVAFDGTNYLVVWQHLPTENAIDDRSDIFGARVTRAGEVLDPEGIPIATTTDRESRPVLAFDGTNYLVAWHERSGGIHATRVSTAGTVLDSTALTISPTGSNATVAYGCGSYLVVWKNTSDSRIIASRVGTDGSVLDPAGVTISPSAHNAAEPAIAFDGTNYLVAWDDNRNDPWGDIFAARVSPAGTVLDPSGIAVAANSPPTGPAQREPSVAANGSFLVAWRDDRRLGVSADGADIFAARVNSDGAVLDPSGISLTNSATYDSQPAVAPGAGNTWSVLYRRFAVERQYGADRVFQLTVSGSSKQPMEARAGSAAAERPGGRCHPMRAPPGQIGRSGAGPHSPR